jgi:P-type E1-E2 ATPase
MIMLEVPGAEPVRLDHLVLDLNGTLTNRGDLLPGVAERVAELRAQVQVHVVTADTFGAADHLGRSLGMGITKIADGAEKVAFVERLGPWGTAAIGNGANDAAMLRIAALGIAVLGPEGAAAATMLSARIVCASILDALDLLLDTRALAATLRP